jgi:hypothetical protein
MRSGRKVTFDFDFNVRRLPNTEVWIIVSDSRSLPEKEACLTMDKTAKLLKEMRVKHLFKKIDSALRGHIVPEINVLRNHFPIEKIYILPGNPEAGRIVHYGQYTIDGVPLNKTAFARDPDFPARSCDVREILKLPNALKEYITPDLLEIGDYRRYHVEKGVLPAGGSVFFETCMPYYFAKINPPTSANTPLPLTNVLMICGSAHENSRRFIDNDTYFQHIEIPRREVNPHLRSDRFRALMARAVEVFNRCGKLLISVETGDASEATPAQVKLLLSNVSQTLIKLCPVKELLIEGGATAYACLQARGFSSLIPVEEFARGVVRLKVAGKENLHLTIKPGSYEWPEKLFQV